MYTIKVTDKSVKQLLYKIEINTGNHFIMVSYHGNNGKFLMFDPWAIEKIKYDV